MPQFCSMSLCAHFSYVSQPPSLPSLLAASGVWFFFFFHFVFLACFLHSTLHILGTLLFFFRVRFQQIGVREENTTVLATFYFYLCLFHNISGKRLVGQSSKLISFAWISMLSEGASSSVCIDLMASLLACHLGLLIPGHWADNWLMNWVFCSRASVPLLQGIVRPVIDCLWVMGWTPYPVSMVHKSWNLYLNNESMPNIMIAIIWGHSRSLHLLGYVIHSDRIAPGWERSNNGLDLVESCHLA